MTPTAARIGLVMLIGAAIGGTTSGGAAAAHDAPTQCMFNDDCASPLVCASGRCRVQCRTERDCGVGETCVGQGAAQICAAPQQAARPGELYGRVESAGGVPVRDCRIELVGIASTSCDGRGEFRLVDLEPGGYELRVRAAGERLLPRTVTVWVDAGDRECAGAITLVARRDLTVIDDAINPSDPSALGGGGGKSDGTSKGK